MEEVCETEQKKLVAEEGKGKRDRIKNKEVKNNERKMRKNEEVTIS